LKKISGGKERRRKKIEASRTVVQITQKGCQRKGGMLWDNLKEIWWEVPAKNEEGEIWHKDQI